MKLLLVNISLDARLGGGTAERTRHLAIHLARAGHSCTAIAITGNSWHDDFAAAGVAYQVTGSVGRRFPVPLARPLRTWRMVRDADAIHILGYWNLLSVGIGLLARLAGTPYVLCPAGEFASISRPRPVMKLFHRLLGKRLIRDAAALVAITPLESELIARVSGRRQEDVWVVPNAVALPAPRGEPAAGAGTGGGVLDLLPAEPYLLFMGRLAPIKGPDLLLQAYLAGSLAHDVPLVFAGPDAGMRNTLEREAQSSAAAGRIHFIGFVSEEERGEVYGRALLLVIPSRSEAMSLVALEAGAHGVPVLLTRACGFDEVEAAGGGLVVSADAQGLHEGLVSLLGRRAGLPAMGAALRQLVAGKYSWPATASELAGRLSALRRRR